MDGITLTITREPDGAVSVAGPLHDKGICYALLELARDAIKDHHDKAAGSAIVRAGPADVLPFAPRG